MGKKKISIGKRVFHVLSWALLVGMFIAGAALMSDVIDIPDAPFTVAGFLNSVGILVAFMILMGIAVIGVSDSLEVKRPCSVCIGSGYVPAVGAWASEYDEDICFHCGGSGEEPKKI